MALLSRRAVGSLLAVMVASCVLAAPAQAQMCKLPPTGNPSCASDSTSQSSPNPATGVGNPIDLTSGNKYQQEIDIEAPGELAIGFRRHYNSMQAGAGVLGKGWSHTYETRLSRTETRSGPGGKAASPPQITLIQGDGRQITFESYDATTTVRHYRSVPAGYGLIEEDVGAITRLRESKALNRTLALDELKVWKWTWPDSRTLTFNGRGLLQTIARPDGRALQVQFDAQRRLSRVTDRSGNWLAAVYWDDAAARLEDFSASGKRGSGYRGRLKELTLSTGERYHYEYDTQGDLSDVVYPDGTVRRYEYDAGNGHHLAKIIGRDGKLAASYEYDSTGHAIRSSHPDHQDDVKVRYEWPQDNQTTGHTIVESATGEKTTYTWRSDPQARSPVILEADGPGCRTCAAGNVRYEYDGHERIARTVRLGSDGEPIEQVASSIDELGRTRTVEISGFSGDGKPRSPQWRETREYTGNSLLPTLIVRPSVVPGRTHTLRVEYNEQGQPTRITEKGFRIEEPSGAMPVSLDSTPSAPLERVTVLTYRHVNGLSLLASVDGPLPGSADTWTYRYDAAGRLLSVAYPGGITETFERDTWGRVTGHVGVDAVRETLEYDTNGNITRFARGDSWMTLGYDDAGRIARILDSLGQLLTLTRDDSGELVEIADVAGNRIHWNYGAHGDVKALTLLNPDGSLEQRARPATAEERPTQLAAAIPNEAMLSALDRALPDEVAAAMPGLASVSNTGRTSANATRTAYDQQGRVTTYTYDDFGRLTAEHSPISGTTRFHWDEADHLIERIAADDSATRISRDALGRAIRVRAGPEDGHIQWGAANRPVRVTYLGGEERFEYDAQARLSSHVLAVDGKEFRITYEFDALGRLSRKHLPDGSVLRYRYNGPLHPKPGVLAGIYLEGLLERPIATDLNSSNERFANRGFTFGNGLAQRRVLNVDGQVITDGNPKVGQSHLDGFSATYTHTAGVGSALAADALPPLTARFAAQMAELGARSDVHATQTVATPNFVNAPTFDVRGQVVEDSQREYEWDALGRLIRVSRAEAPPGFHRTSFSDTVAPTAAPQRIIAEYRYNLFGERIAKLVNGPTGPKLTYFLWDGTELAAEMDEHGAVLRDYVYLDSRPIALLSGHAIYAVHTDHRLAPVAVTDSNRRVVWQADVHDNGAADVLPGSELELPLRASNQYFDAETGLHYNLHRYLDARQGHYLSPDPMGLAAGTDVYQFALGRPHAFVDLLGLQATKADWSKASYTDKLVEIIKRAVPLVPGEIGAALQQLIQPSNLVVMGAIFTAFAAAQATPIGWIADAAILGYSAWSLGSGLTVIIDTLLQLNTDTKNAKCDPDLTAAAKRLAAGFVSGTGQVSSGLLGVFGVKSGGGITRIANGITTLVDYAKSALGVTEETALVIQGTAGTVPVSPPLQRGLGGTVPQSQTGIVWATDVSGIKGQGLRFEDYAETQLPPDSRLPPNFKTFDFFDQATGVATSAKTLNTLAPGYSANPASIYSALTGYIDAMKSFTTYSLKGTTLNAAQITSREMQLAVPAGTTAAQWAQINRAITYASQNGMKLIVTVVQ
jgi:RHS repeat-associated protein